MILSEIRTAVLELLREESGNTAFTSTELNRWINRGYSEVWRAHNWDFRKRQAIRRNVYTLCSDAGDSTGTTLYVDSSAGICPGMELYVSDGSNYELVEVASVTGNTVTLISPGLTATYTDGDYVAGAHIYLPHDCQTILDMRVADITSTAQEAERLIPIDERDYDTDVPWVKSRGRTTHYIPGPMDYTREAGLTADANTSTTTVVDSALTGAEDDYYVGWLLTNTTSAHGGSARVSDYVASTKTITLESAITGQASSDTYQVERRLQKIYLHPAPDDDYAYRLRYVARFPALVNDYDTPTLGRWQEELESAVIEYATAQALLNDGQGDKATAHSQICYSILDDVRGKNQTPADGGLRMGLGGNII